MRARIEGETNDAMLRHEIKLVAIGEEGWDYRKDTL